MVGPDFLGRHLRRVHGISRPWADRGGRPRDSRADGTQVLTTQIALQASWVGSGTLAALTSAMLPENIAGMEFALTSLFIVLGWEAFAQHRDFSLVFAGGHVGQADAGGCDGSAGYLYDFPAAIQY